MRRVTIVSTAVLAIALFAAPASSQVNVMAAPIYGTFNVNSGFTPDPQQNAVVAGGPVAASSLGAACRGWITAAPTVRVNYTAGTFPLRFYVDSPSDTALAINGPDGSWYCNDDTVGLNPVVDFATPQSGQYDVFVATYASGQSPPVTLFMTELPATYGPGGPSAGTPPPTGQATGINVMGAPAFGVFTINSGFTPDPQQYAVVAGGPVDASGAGPSCRGWITATPTVRINYTAGTFPLRFYVDSPSDTTLAVNAPNGTWQCNDDSVGLNPVIDFGTPQSGQYDIFVGSYAAGQTPPVTLYVTELPASHGPGMAGPPTGTTPPTGLVPGINVMGTPGFGVYTVNSGFTPDPQTVTVTAGGPADATTAARACNAGHIPATPTVRVNYTAGTFPLRFYVSTPGTDTTLAVNAPDGTWHCNDDTVGLQPVIDFPTPQSGQYDIFVGTFSQGQSPAVQLYWTELPATYGPTQ